MSSISVPSPQLTPMSSLAVNGKKARSLSNNGMPKQPRNLTVERPQRFSALGLASPSFRSGLRSPGPFSPPLSARSVGTFIDSEPSTPAYSPRPNFDWDGSTLVLLKPMSSPFEPNFPHEQTWELIDPRTNVVSPSQPPFSAQSEFTPRVLSPLSIRSTRSTRSTRSHAAHREIKIVDLSEKLHEIQIEEESDEDKEKEPEEEQSNNSSSAPLGKLASKMKLMLSRKSASEKKKSKKEKDYFDVEHLGDQHWSEM